MKTKPIGILVILLIGQGIAAFAGSIVDTVRCKSDPGQSYALYVPDRGNKEILPIVYFFDPHGAGSLPLNKYKALADAYGFIMVGSNNSKNGNDWGLTDNIWKHLWEDTKGRLKINVNRIYTCGFSGGAKVASYVAIQYPGIRGVVVGGAGLPDGVSAGDFPFAMTILAGQGDMNMTDLVGLNRELDRTKTRHRLILFDGKHEWAPEKSMNTAFAALQLDAMSGGLLAKDPVFIDKYVQGSKQRVSGYKTAGQLIRAMRECRLAQHMLEGLSSETKWFTDQASALSGNAAYRKQEDAEEALLAREQTIKTGYMQQFQSGDMAYWNRTIADLTARARAATAEGGMYQRLLAYLSLAFYSISNHLIAGGGQGADHFVSLYKLADPTNPEAWYFSAILHARAGQRQESEGDLSTAIRYGFNDRNRIEKEAVFQKLFSRADYNRIEGKIH